MDTIKKEYMSGVFFILLSAVLWGASGASSEYLLEEYHMSASWLGMIRMLGSALFLFLLLLPKERENLKGILRDRESWPILIIFSIIGLMANQLTYLMAIDYTDAGTATVLQYIAPVLILVYVCVSRRKLPAGKEFAGICLTLTGIFLITTHGNIHSLVISPEGLTWGLASAVTMAVYNLLPIGIIRKWGALSITCYGMLIGGIFNALLFRQWNAAVNLDLSALGALFIVVVMGTAFPYTMYLIGVEKIGAVNASMIGSVEPLAATLFTVLLLGTSFTAMEIIGFMLIVATVIILSYKGKVKVKEPIKEAIGEVAVK